MYLLLEFLLYWFSFLGAFLIIWLSLKNLNIHKIMDQSSANVVWQEI